MMLGIVKKSVINWTKCWQFSESLAKVSIYYQSICNGNNYISLLPYTALVLRDMV